MHDSTHFKVRSLVVRETKQLTKRLSAERAACLHSMSSPQQHWLTAIPSCKTGSELQNGKKKKTVESHYI